MTEKYKEMETKHTQGEWIKKSPKNRVIQITNKENLIICEIDILINKVTPTPSAAEANAKLIAAAPDLLEALIDLAKFCKENNTGVELELAENAINKATK